MIYLCLSFSLLWIFTFGYFVFLDRQLKDISKRLRARSE